MMFLFGMVLFLVIAGGATCSSTADVVNQPTYDVARSNSVEMLVSAELYVSPSGRPDNSGSIDSPLDLASALAGSKVKPGTVIWLRGGVYLGAFQSDLKGTQNAPIFVRQYAGERVVIDGNGFRGARENAVLAVFGEWTNYWGFEVTNSNPDRGYRSQADRPQGVVVKAPHTKFINMVVHDTGNGFGFWREAVDSELYGNIIFNCGARDPNPEGRGHGHAVYTQNDSGTKVIRDNITFNQFGRGINAYPNPGSLRGFHIEGNISFNNGVWQAADIRYPNILVGGYAPFKSERMVIINNYTYHSSRQVPRAVKFTGSNLCLGCSDPLENKDLVLKDNYAVGGVPVAYIGKWERISMSGNTFYGDNGLIRFNPLSSGIMRSYDWNNNSYFGSGRGDFLFLFNNAAYRSFAEWQRPTGLDQSSQYTPGPPTGTKIFVRPNQYESGRANIAVYNWDRKEMVEVDLKGVLESGKQFEVRNVQDYFGPPVLRGTYDGRPVKLPMMDLYATPPTGMKSASVTTSPEFNVFVVLSNTGQISSRATSGDRSERRSGEQRDRRATVPVSSSDLRKFVGRYRSTTKPVQEAQVQLSGSQLRLFVKNEAATYTLLPVTPTRFQVKERAGYFLEFDVRDDKVMGVTVTDGRGNTITAIRN
jgi:hypothetical protein